MRCLWRRPSGELAIARGGGPRQRESGEPVERAWRFALFSHSARSALASVPLTHFFSCILHFCRAAAAAQTLFFFFNKKIKKGAPRPSRRRSRLRCSATQRSTSVSLLILSAPQPLGLSALPFFPFPCRS